MSHIIHLFVHEEIIVKLFDRVSIYCTMTPLLHI